jgi:hypothetical protein
METRNRSSMSPTFKAFVSIVMMPRPQSNVDGQAMAKDRDGQGQGKGKQGQPIVQEGSMGWGGQKVFG